MKWHCPLDIAQNVFYVIVSFLYFLSEKEGPQQISSAFLTAQGRLIHRCLVCKDDDKNTLNGEVYSEYTPVEQKWQKSSQTTNGDYSSSWLRHTASLKDLFQCNFSRWRWTIENIPLSLKKLLFKFFTKTLFPFLFWSIFLPKFYESFQSIFIVKSLCWLCYSASNALLFSIKGSSQRIDAKNVFKSTSINILQWESE